MKREESIQLRVLTTNRYKTSTINDSNILNNKLENGENTDLFKEEYPDLKMTEQQIITRSKQFKIISKKEKQKKSMINRGFNYFNLWKIINSKISIEFGSDICSYFKINMWIIFHIIFVSLLSISFIIIPTMASKSLKNNWLPDYIDQLLSTDQKWLINTPVFYGFYNYSFTNDTDSPYSISKAYFYVNVFSRIFYILCLLRKLIINISMIYALGHILKSAFSISSLFALWNYQNIKNWDVIRNKMVVNHFIKKILSPTIETKKMFLLKSTLVNLICLIFTIIILERTSWVLENDEKYMQQHSSSEIPFWLVVRVPVTVSICLVCATWLFDFIQCLESFRNDNIKIFSSIIRVLIINAGMLILLIYTWTRMVWCVQYGKKVNNQTTCFLIREHIVISSKSLLNFCWETWIGQRILLHFLTYLFIWSVFSFSVDVIKTIMRCLQIYFIKPKFFQISLYGNLFFFDGLFWFGFYYSPVIPMLYVLVLILTYFYHVGIISVSSFPRSSLLHNAKIHKTLFLSMLFLSSFIGLVSLIYQSIIMKTSSFCGPFQSLEYNYFPDSFSFSEYFKNQKLILKIIHLMSNIIFNNNGVWFSIIVIIVALCFKYVFRTTAISEIRKYVLTELQEMKMNKNSLSEDLQLEIRKLHIDKSVYHPGAMKNDNLDIFFNQFQC